jgi:3-hydroxymyristoyl/3-hydroxydecanoyl-(acyl carrier protein) dehydratase
MSRVEFDFCVAANHPGLPGHFPGHPIVPGVLVLDHVLEGLRQLTGRDVVHLRQVRFTSALGPGEQAHACCEVEGAKVIFHVTAQRQGLPVAVAQGAGSLSPANGAGNA